MKIGWSQTNHYGVTTYQVPSMISYYCLQHSRAVSTSRRHTAPSETQQGYCCCCRHQLHTTGGAAIRKGEMVWTKWRYGKTYCGGIIRALNTDGTFDISYSRGIQQRSVPLDRIRFTSQGVDGAVTLADRFL